MRQKGWFVLDAATAVAIVLAVVCPIEGSIANAATCSGVVLASGSSIQKAIDSHAGGTTYCLSGTYTTATPISPKDGDRFIGTAATNISGTGSGVFSGGKNVLYDSIGIGPSPGDGVRPGSGSTIQNSTIHDNNKCGITTFGSSLLITNNEIARNGSTSTSPISQACGLKIRGMQGSDSGAYSTVSNNVVHDNVHTALWVDCNGHDNVFSNNTVYGNTGIALDEETGYRDTFRGNIVHDNGFGFQIQAVSILDSMGGTVANNTLTNNYRGVRI